MDAIYTEQYKGYTIQIHQDDDALNPRQEFDNASHFVCWHNRYNLGDKHSYRDVDSLFESLAREISTILFNKVWDKYESDELDESAMRAELVKIVENNTVMLGLYLYDHSGITISASAFNDPWDSGQIGFAYLTRADVVKEFGKWDKRTREKARKLILGEVDTYDDYLTGNVYGYVVLDENGKDTDSCWGFYGDYNKYVLDQAREIADYNAKERDERIKAKDAQLSKVKTFFNMGS